MSAEIIRHGSGGPYEASIGYSRVVVGGGFAFTAGCTSTIDGAVVAAGLIDPDMLVEVELIAAIP